MAKFAQDKSPVLGGIPTKTGHIITGQVKIYETVKCLTFVTQWVPQVKMMQASTPIVK